MNILVKVKVTPIFGGLLGYRYSAEQGSAVKGRGWAPTLHRAHAAGWAHIDVKVVIAA